MPPLPKKEAVGQQTLPSDKEERTGEGDSSGYTEVKNKARMKEGGQKNNRKHNFLMKEHCFSHDTCVSLEGTRPFNIRFRLLTA